MIIKFSSVVSLSDLLLVGQPFDVSVVGEDADFFHNTVLKSPANTDCGDPFASYTNAYFNNFSIKGYSSTTEVFEKSADTFAFVEQQVGGAASKVGYNLSWGTSQQVNKVEITNLDAIYTLRICHLGIYIGEDTLPVTYEGPEWEVITKGGIDNAVQTAFQLKGEITIT